MNVEITKAEALALLAGERVPYQGDLSLQIKRKLVEPLPAWVEQLDHAAQMSVKATCACGASHSWTVGGALLPETCRTCHARDVHEARNPTWPRWTFDLLRAYNAAHGTRFMHEFPFDRARARFETWYAERRPDLRDVRLQYYLCGRAADGTPEGPPGWYMAGFEKARERVVWIIDLHHDRTNDPTQEDGFGVSWFYAFDPEAGNMLATMFREEQVRGVLR